MGFIYYLPNEAIQTTTEALIDKYALEYAFKQKPWARPIANNAPDGGQGVVLSDGDTAPKVSGKTQWIPMVCRDDLPAAWLGWNGLPEPQELQKSDGLQEFTLEMGDGKRWAFPMIRACSLETGEPQCQLPFRWKVTSDGQWQPGDPVEQWKYLWDITEPAWLSMVNADDDSVDTELSHEHVLEIALALFRVNYRIGPTEFNAMGVFTRDCNPVNLIAKCIGWDTFELWREIKKKSPATTKETQSPTSLSETNGSTTSGGNEGSTPDTCRPAQT